jgi:hypothetical protein
MAPRETESLGQMDSRAREVFDQDGGSRGFYDERNRLNDLTGREWVFATRSVIPRSYPPSLQFELRNQHGGQKPPELCAELIRTFTKEGMLVLDPFMGVGGTLLGASLCGRRAVGIEIEGRWVEVYQEVCRREGMAPHETHVGNCLDVLPSLHTGFDFILTDVPFWNMDTAPRSDGRFKRVGRPVEEARLRKNLSRFGERGPATREEWLDEMGSAFTLCLPLLKKKRYLAVMIGDMYQGGRYHLLSAALAERLEACGWVLKANLVWYDVGKQLHLYGYRYAFIPSLVHQNILVFRKE